MQAYGSMPKPLGKAVMTTWRYVPELCAPTPLESITFAVSMLAKARIYGWGLAGEGWRGLERAGGSNGYVLDMCWPTEKRALQNLGKRHPHKWPCSGYAPTYVPQPKSIDLQSSCRTPLHKPLFNGFGWEPYLSMPPPACCTVASQKTSLSLCAQLLQSDWRNDGFKFVLHLMVLRILSRCKLADWS